MGSEVRCRAGPGAYRSGAGVDRSRSAWISDRVVKVYLLSIDDRRFFFYADESETPDDLAEPAGSSGSASAGWWFRLHDRYQSLLSAWERSESGVSFWTRRAWKWLHSWAHPDEAMLVRLRSARSIKLHHPASRAGTEVRALWARYLNHRWWHHVTWLSLDAMLTPFSVLLAPLPGPNVIGYWFLYRAIHHGLIVSGIRKLRRQHVPLELDPLPSLDRPIQRDASGKAKHEALNGAAVLLDEYVAWTESESTSKSAGVIGAADAAEMHDSAGSNDSEHG
jgi:hypothetical protein